MLTRFLAKVDKNGPNDCWVWTGCRNQEGYGLIWHNGKTRKAHRVSYEMHRGLIPEGMLVCHTCDVPSCVNPVHLFLGTNADNVRDMVAKGRATRAVGETNAKAKLTDKQVREIREKLANGQTQVSLAAEYGIAQAGISDIYLGKRWRHVEQC